MTLEQPLKCCSLDLGFAKTLALYSTVWSFLPVLKKACGVIIIFHVLLHDLHLWFECLNCIYCKYVVTITLDVELLILKHYFTCQWEVHLRIGPVELEVEM